jgi:hypothetical protein
VHAWGIWGADPVAAGRIAGAATPVALVPSAVLSAARTAGAHVVTNRVDLPILQP